MNQKQELAAKIERPKVIDFVPAQSPDFLKNEINRLRERCKHLNHKSELQQAALDYYQDKADTLEKLCVDNGLMLKTKHLGA